ncbi:hypothetical protein GCM10010406_20790 [Streptomyces thermolineatus]|uniref:Uncharacterized protein n=1 Tax=Streptomyces thermolineatus TaxID=44033 RepID=A0ABN3LI72_9ACTN
MPHAQLVDRGEIARHLRDLADHPLLAVRRDELLCLAGDLESGTGLEQWAGLDLPAVLARPESLTAAPGGEGRGGTDPAGAERPGDGGSVGSEGDDGDSGDDGDDGDGRGDGGARGDGDAPGAEVPGEPRVPAPVPASGAGVVPGVRGRLSGLLRRRSGTGDVLETVLGGLVFVPLLVTWYGLWDAARAYGELSAQDPEQAASRPFLQLWQSGFDGRLSVAGRFENVALTVVVLVSLLLLIAGWHARARVREERARAARYAADCAEREQLLGRLASVLTRAQLALVEHRGDGTGRFVRELEQAAGRLEELVDRALQGTGELVRAAGAVGRATTAVDGAARRLEAGVPLLGEALGRIEETVRAGQEQTVRVGAEHAASAREVGDRIGRAAGLVEAAVRDLAGVQKDALAASGAAADAADRASRALVDSTARTGQAVDGMREATERWDAAAAHWQDAAARLDAGVHALVGVLPAPPAGRQEEKGKPEPEPGPEPAPGPTPGPNPKPDPGSSPEPSPGPGQEHKQEHGQEAGREQEDSGGAPRPRAPRPRAPQDTAPAAGPQAGGGR